MGEEKSGLEERNVGVKAPLLNFCNVQYSQLSKVFPNGYEAFVPVLVSTGH